MKQAGELAATTAKLLNVSEFTSVDEATSALVSSLQAFTTEGQDVGQRAEEIVDILNHIGNRYPVATNELADGLATSSAALVAANNSIEEQVALLSAGNATMQDISTVASGLKIVAARLRGTTTDIDDDADSAITNVSKLQSKIKALTKEANGGEGVDIINEKGEYKSTYEILTEISKIFDKMDDISSASLLELIAGKNRSSVVAAILQNGDILEDAYADAFDSNSSAQKELDAYLDSIQGRIDLFNNSVQTMWMNFIDSEVLKFIINLGTGFIKLVDNVGLLETALTGLLIYLNASSKHKIDLASMFGIHDIKDGWFAKIKTSADTTKISVDNLFSTLDKVKNVPLQMGTDIEMAKQVDLLNQKWNEGQESFIGYVSTLGDADIALKAYAASVQDGNYSLAGFQQFIQQHNAGLKASGVAAKAAAVGHQLLNAALSMGISLLISGAISAITKWANSAKEAAKAANEAAEASEALREQFDSLEEYKKKIIEIRKELDSNTLSESDAYDAREKLLTIQNELIDKFGLERDGINLVTGAIQDQIAAIDELSKKEAQTWINQNQEEINAAIKYFDDANGGGKLDGVFEQFRFKDEDFVRSGIINWGSTKNIASLIDKYANTHDNIATSGDFTSHYIGFDGSVEEVKAAVEDFSIWLGEQQVALTAKKAQLLALPDQTDDVKAQIDSIESDLEQLRDVYGEIGAESKNWFGDGSAYAANKKIIEELQHNTALTQYADQYMQILQAQNDLTEAQALGDKDEVKRVLDILNNITGEASTMAEQNGQSYMVSFFDGIQSEYRRLSGEFQFEKDLSENSSYGGDGVRDIIRKVLDQYAGMNALEIRQEFKMGKTNSLEFNALSSLASRYKMNIDELIDALVKFGYIESGFVDQIEEISESSKTYSTLVEQITQYNDIVNQTSEIVSDNTEVTQEYKDSLLELGISQEELNECFDENNKLVVKDAKALNNLVKSAKKNTAQNIKLAKSQAQLEYYDLYKEIKNLTNGTEVVDGVTLDYINSLYKQMNVLQRTIAKYSLLEAELLGAANAYQELADAQAADEAMDYGSKAEELVNVLAEAFNTAQLGTEAARVAIEGLVPPEVFADADTLDEKMQKIYEYFTEGEISKLFTIEFDDEGAIKSVEMTKENVEKYIKGLIGTGDDAVFQGSWDEFTLNPAIKSMEDFQKATGLTRELAFAFLTELEKYDIGNIFGGGDSLLDHLMGDNLDYQLQKAIETAAEVEKKLAEGTLKAVDKEYQDAQKNLEAYEEQTIENVTAWSRQQQALNKQKDLLKEYQKEYENAVKNQDTSKIEEFEGKIQDTSKEIDILIDDLRELDEPTEFVLEVAMSEAKENIAEFKEDIDELIESGDKKAIRINSFIEKIDATGLDDLEDIGFVKHLDGTWRGTANIEGWATLDPASKQKVLEYIDLIESEHQIDVAMGEDMPTVEDHLATIAKVLEDIAKILDPTYTLSVETSEAEQKATTFKNIWEGIQSKAVTLTKNVVETVTSIFTRTPKDEDGTSVNGTAHMSGTANAGGSWGAPKTEMSLTGELGPEILVRGNRWTTVGENGAEFTQVKKGDIIFNHKQTESLLKNGYVTGRGKAYANGTAYANAPKFHAIEASGSIDTWDSGYKMVYNNYKNATINTNGSNSNNNLSGDYGNKGNDDFEEIFDWFEVALEELTDKIELASAKLENLATASEKNAKIDEIISYNKELIGDDDNPGLLDHGRKLYTDEAAKIWANLDEYHQGLANNGAIDLELFKGSVDEETLENIQKYREYMQKADELRLQHEQAEAEISDLAKQKFDNIVTEYENKIGLLESANDNIEANIELMENQGFENVNAEYGKIIGNIDSVKTSLENEKAALIATRDEQIRLGNIKVGSEEWYEMENAIADVDAKIIGCTASIEEYSQKKFDAITNQFENELSLLDIENEQLQARIDLMEESGEIASPAYYEELMKNEESRKTALEKEKKALEDLLDAEIAAGNIEVGSDAWYEQIGAINDVNAEILESIANTEEYQNAINDIHWERFDELVNRFGYVRNEAQSLIDLMSDADKFVTPDNEDGWGEADVTWTDEGLASLGLYAQQMEIAEYEAKKYEEQIAELNKQYGEGKYSEIEYLEKLNELKDAQYESVEAYQDAKDAIIDLNKERIEAIKNGIEKEIEAYDELISKKKEELSAEKDLYDFQKDVANQNKNIAELERKLAALSGDNSASARAKRAQLEAELYEAKASLEETYYDRSVSDQQNALDKELENFQDQKNAEIESWDKYLGNVELLISDSLAMVQANTSAVLTTLEALQAQYGITVTETLMKPWEYGAYAIQDYGIKLGISLAELSSKFGLTVDEFAAKLGLTTEMLVSNLDITVAQMAENLGLTNEQLAAKLGLTVTDLNGMMGLTIQDLAARIGITLPALAEQLGTTTDGLAGKLDITMTQFAGKMGLTVEDLSSKFGLSAESLADKLGMTYQNLMNPFGLSMSATVKALENLEENYIDTLENISEKSKETVEDVNKAMDAYDNPVGGQSQPNTNSSSSSQPTSTTTSNTPTRSEKDYYGVALAIWNGNHGWGTGRTRMNRLTNKGFDANKVQDIVNKLGAEGYVYSGAWIGRYHGIKDLASYNFNRYAKGTISADKDQLAIIDELGEELQLVPGKNGRLEYIKKGTGIVPADLTSNLMSWGELNPQDMLDRNRPQITPSKSIVNTEINIDCSVDTMVKIEHCDQGTLPDVEKLVNKAFDKHMQNLNNSIKKLTR